MQIQDLSLEGPKLISYQLYPDDRGFFFESYRKDLLSQSGIETEFVQENVSFSKYGTIRALHYQKKPGQAKLVSCVSGTIWDVVVDIRPESKTYLQWEAVELSDTNCFMLFIPIGFAHGFCALSKTARVQYKVSAYYDPSEEMSIRWNDPLIGIHWPIDDPILSKRDRESPLVEEQPFFSSGSNVLKRGS